MSWQRAWLAILALLAVTVHGCRAATPAAPTPTATPLAPTTTATAPPATATPTPIPSPSPPPLAVRGDPQSLVVQPEDLPPGLELVGGQYDAPNDYTVVYFDAAALVAENPLRMTVLGVVANVVILDDAESAAEALASMGELDEDAIAAGIAGTSGEVRVYSVRAYADQIEGADVVEALRVHYAIGGVDVVAYHYRMVVDNALASLVITSRADSAGSDPPGFRDRAREVSARQIVRLVGARQPPLQTGAYPPLTPHS
jgi:hypothetical protein